MATAQETKCSVYGTVLLLMLDLIFDLNTVPRTAGAGHVGPNPRPKECQRQWETAKIRKGFSQKSSSSPINHHHFSENHHVQWVNPLFRLGHGFKFANSLTEPGRVKIITSAFSKLRRVATKVYTLMFTGNPTFAFCLMLVISRPSGANAMEKSMVMVTICTNTAFSIVNVCQCMSMYVNVC